MEILLYGSLITVCNPDLTVTVVRFLNMSYCGCCLRGLEAVELYFFTSTSPCSFSSVKKPVPYLCCSNLRAEWHSALL